MTLIKLILSLNFCFQLFFFNLAPEIRIPLFGFLTSLCLILLTKHHRLSLPKSAGFYLGYLLFCFVSYLAIQPNYQALLVFLFYASLLGHLILVNTFFIHQPQSKTLFCTLLVYLIAFWALTGIVDYTNRLGADRLPVFEPFHWPSLAASAFVLTLPLSLYLFIASSKTFTRLLYFLTSTILAVAWLLSREYLYFLPMIVLLLFFFNPHKSRFKTSTLVLFLIITLILSLNLAGTIGSTQIDPSAALFQNKVYFLNQTDQWAYLQQIIATRLGQGIGLGKYAANYQPVQPQPFSWGDFGLTSLTHTFVEIGLPGALCLLGFLAITTYTAILLFFKSTTFLIKILALNLIFIGFFSLTNFSFVILPLAIIQFTLIGLTSGYFPQTNIAHPLTTSSFVGLCLFTLFILKDAFGLQMAQRYYLNQHSDTNQLLLSFTTRPAFLLDPRTYVWLTALSFDNHDYQTGLSYLTKLAHLSPNSPEISYQTAYGYLHLGQLAQAEALLTDLITTSPHTDPKYYLLLFQALLSQGKSQPAMTLIAQAKDIFPLSKLLTLNEDGFRILQTTGYLDNLEKLYTYSSELSSH